MPIHIRLASEADAPTVARFRCQMFLDMGSLDPADFDPLYQYCLPAIAQGTARGELTSWLALDDAVVIGSATIRVRESLPRPVPANLGGGVQPVTREGLVMNVYVQPDYRGKGIAKQLMHTVQAWGYQQGLRHLLLHASEEGRPLYERLGWVASNEMRYTWPDTGLPPLPTR